MAYRSKQRLCNSPWPIVHRWPLFRVQANPSAFARITPPSAPRFRPSSGMNCVSNGSLHQPPPYRSTAEPTMKVASIERAGAPSVLKTLEMPVPEIAPNEVLLALYSAGVGIWDADIRKG